MTCAEGGDLFTANSCNHAPIAQLTPARQALYHLPPATHFCMCMCACLLTAAQGAMVNRMSCHMQTLWEVVKVLAACLQSHDILVCPNMRTLSLKD